MSDHLPLELAIEILKRLPVKSVLRFRCVSKTWFSLIESPDFITLHLNQTTSDSNKTQTLIRHFSKTHGKEMFSLHFDNDTFDEDPAAIEFPFRGKTPYYFRVVGCCNGLVCLSDDLFRYTDTVILWNPSVRRFFTLPVPQKPLEKSDGFDMFALGFGVDPNTNDHKVVRMNYLLRGDEYIVPPEVEVFSLCSGNWRGIKTTSPYCIPVRFWSQALIKGVVHWVAYHLTMKNGVRTFRSLVLSFDMGSEEFGELNLPESLINVSPVVMSAVIFGGSLTILQYDRRTTSSTCSVWVMREYGIADSWCNQFNIDLGGGLGLALGLRRNGEVLLATRSGELVSYNYGTRTSFSIGKCGTKDSFHVGNYIQSLILMTKGDKVLERESRMAGSASSSSEEVSVWGDAAENIEVTNACATNIVSEWDEFSLLLEMCCGLFRLKIFWGFTAAVICL